MPLVIMAAPLNLPWPHRQQRLGAVERLDLRLFIDAEHQGAVGRIDVEPDNVAHPRSGRGQALVDKQRVGRQLEGLGAVRLQAEGAPDTADARGRDAAVTRHAARAPVRGRGRLALQRPHDDALDHGIVDLTRHPRPRLVAQPVEATLDKAPAPLADCLHGHPLARRHHLVAQARGAGQHDPAPATPKPAPSAALRVTFQDTRNRRRQFNLGYRTTRSHPHPHASF